MEVRTEHEKTKVAAIPEGWELKRIQEIAPLQRGFDLPTKNIREGPFPVVYSNGILNWHQSFQAKGPGVVTGRSGTIGKVTFVEDDYWPHNTSLWVTDFKGNDPKFIYYLYSFIDFGRFGTGSGVPTLNRNDVHASEIAVPQNASEQTAIATALSDVDTLISNLEKLIAKKRNIKQGAMQLLLTGKKRLPGLSEEWETKELGAIFSIKVGKSLSCYISNGGAYVVVDMGSVSTEGTLLLTKTTDFKGDFLDSGDLVMPKDDIGGGNIIGKVAYIDANNRYVLGDHVYALKCKQGCSRFFSYLINSYHTNMSFRKKVAGSAQLGLSRKSVEKQELYFPCIEEQTAIAQVLSDMDAEIEGLEHNLAKYRLLKQGMMQELLTGKTRLM